MADETPVTPVIVADGPLFTQSPIAPEMQQKIRTALDALPQDHHVAILVAGDMQGNAEARIALRPAQHWEFVAGGTYSLTEKRPKGYFGIEASF